MENEGDNFYMWQHPALNWQRIAMSTSVVEILPIQQNGDTFHSIERVTVNGKTLQCNCSSMNGTGHTWIDEYWCKSPEDARLILDLPWNDAVQDAGDFFTCEQLLANKGIMWCTIPSPLYVVYALFSPTLFYELIIIDRQLLHELLERMQQRIEQSLTALLDAGPKRLILTVTGTPLEQISECAKENYHAMMDTALDYAVA